MTAPMVRERQIRARGDRTATNRFLAAWYAMVRESMHRKALSDKDGTRTVRDGTRASGIHQEWYVKVLESIDEYHVYQAYLIGFDSTGHRRRATATSLRLCTGISRALRYARMCTREADAGAIRARERFAARIARTREDGADRDARDDASGWCYIRRESGYKPARCVYRPRSIPGTSAYSPCTETPRRLVVPLPTTLPTKTAPQEPR